MKALSLLLVFLIFGCSTPSKQSVQPDIAFEVSEGILHPESILYSPKHKSFFASNLATGNPMETKEVSYISKISHDGKKVEAQWVKGLKAPKGLAIVGDNLYVTDVNRIAQISISKAKIVKSHPIKEAKFLNDLTADSKGNVYASDMLTDIVYRLKDGKLSKWKQDKRLQGANGLLAEKGTLTVVRWGSDVDPETFQSKHIGDIVTVDLNKQNSITVNTEIQGHLDGVDRDQNGNLWVSDWMSGDVYKLDSNNLPGRIYNFGKGTADISFARELNLLLVPQMNQSKLLFVRP